MKHNKTLRICLVMVLAVALVGMTMAHTSVLKATDTGDADYGEAAPAPESTVQSISIPEPVSEPEPTETPAPAETPEVKGTEAAEPEAAQGTEAAEPVVTEETEPEVTEAAPACTCGAEEGQPHAGNCPLYTAPAETDPVALEVHIRLENRDGGETYIGSNLSLIAEVGNVPEGAALSYQWFYSLDGVNWSPISGATAASYDFILDETNNQYYWKVDVNV